MQPPEHSEPQWNGAPFSPPPGQPGQFSPPPNMHPPQSPKKRNKGCMIAGIVTGSLVLLLATCAIIGSFLPSPPASSSAPQAPPPTEATSAKQAFTPTMPPAPTTAPTQVPTKAPTPSVPYPPTTQNDLHGLAALGTVSAIHEFHSESVGLTGACPQPKREVTVDPKITGKQLAEDVLAYFYAQKLDSPCGSIVFAYHNQRESGDIYTAGRINLDVTDSSGNTNVDPHATNLTYKVTLDIGGLGEQEYVVTYERSA